MQTKTVPTATPPRLINSLVAGFNTTASHVYLILFPVILDLVIWLGPRLRIKESMRGLLDSLTSTLAGLAAPDFAASFADLKSLWKVFVEDLNLLDGLRAFPVGVPSLISGQTGIETPIGAAGSLEAPSILAAIALWLGIFLIGSFVGSLYFNKVARICIGIKEPGMLSEWLWQSIQAIILAIMLLVFLVVAIIPVSMIYAVALMISPFLAQLALMAILFVAIWALVPLVFSTHGIFTNHLNALISISASIRLVRFFLPGTGLFIVITILLTEGLNMLWRVPSTNSWMTVVGIAGHAFIATGLLAASFVYYLGGVRMMQETLQRLANDQPNAQPRRS